MKKLVITIAIVLGMSMTTFADGGGLFQRGTTDEQLYGKSGESGPIALPSLPGHDQTDNQDATPLGTGIALMLGLGAAYLVGKRREK